MFQIASLLWVVPGIVGLGVYNRWLTRYSPQITGLPYLFTVVFFALPYYIVFEFLNSNLNLPVYINIPIIEIKFIISTNLYIQTLTLFLSTFFSILLGYYTAELRNKFISYKLDPFYDSCHLWKKKVVLITLKDSKVYLAILFDWTSNINFESTIKVVPLYSGYRDEYRHIYWTFEYPHYGKEGAPPKTRDNLMEPGLIISQKDIMTFSLWDYSHEYTKAAPIENLDIANSQ